MKNSLIICERKIPISETVKLKYLASIQMSQNRFYVAVSSMEIITPGRAIFSRAIADVTFATHATSKHAKNSLSNFVVSTRTSSLSVLMFGQAQRPMLGAENAVIPGRQSRIPYNKGAVVQVALEQEHRDRNNIFVFSWNKYSESNLF